jgi:SAM-dependent methyltransferase
MTMTSDEDLIPPEDLIRIHSGMSSAAEYTAIGDACARGPLIVGVQLRPHHKFLDVGCGCGCLARPLSKYLSADGTYEGLDIANEVIAWCQAAYRSYPNFHFQHADIHNKYYNPGGKYKASVFRFPYPDDVFDCVFLSSVFTHMLPEEVDNYLGEIKRVLKTGGKCLITYFLLDPESRRNVGAGLTTPRFSFAYGSEGCRLDNEAIPEAAIAYDEHFVVSLYGKHRLRLERISHGTWGRGELTPHHQDEVVAVKE